MSHRINRRHAALAPLAWLGTAGLAGCTTTTHTMTSTAPTIDHVPWSRHAAIYEVNIRQFTPEGTLAAFEPTCHAWRRWAWASCGSCPSSPSA
jgi:outer membrane biogenesis lipoprotein LolB